MTPTRVIATCLLVSCASPAEEEVGTDAKQLAAVASIYLFMGQSNMVGGGAIKDLSPENVWAASPVAAPYAEQLNCPKDGRVGPCALSTGWTAEVRPHGPGAYRGGYMGIEMTASRVLLARDSSARFIKHAIDGSSLSSAWDTTDSAQTLWDYATEYIDARLAEVPGAHVAGLLWIQGEADSNTALAAGDYAENLELMILKLRARYGAFPAVLSRTRSGTYQSTLWAEQDAAAAELGDVAIVDTTDLAMRVASPQHYDVNSFVVLGARMAEALP